MNELNVGFNNTINLPKGGYLLLTDEVRDIPRSKVFDPRRHSFNPMKGIDEDKAEELAELLYTLSPGGDGTLTVRNGRIGLAEALVLVDRFDKVKGDDEISLMMRGLLFSPTRRRVLCEKPNFTFSPDAKIQARVNRKELGEKSARVIGLLLLSIYPGQCIVPDFSFYGRDIHSKLIREERLIAGVSYLKELTKHNNKTLREDVMLMEYKFISGSATFDDAEELAKYANLRERTTGHGDWIEGAIR